MNTTIMLFTRDLRVHDNPALAAACASGTVVPIFVWDTAILDGPFAVPNRLHFIGEALTDLRASLRARGGDLIVRTGDPATEVGRIAEATGARAVHLADDRSTHARRRLAALRRLPLAVHAHPGTTVVPPGALTPAGGDHYRVFTPYWRAWTAAGRRPIAGTPDKVLLPPGLSPGEIKVPGGPGSPGRAPGGEGAARDRLEAWLSGGAARYDDDRDRLAVPGTSMLSAALRFGCVSPVEVADRAEDHPGFVRQLAWRDFHYQVAAAFPDLATRDYRDREEPWRDDPEALAAWCEGRTGHPIVDAGMRQLLHEGFMHNRARMITASFLTRNLRIDWRHGYRHFNSLLTDGDVANNAGNWQWTAGTGNNTSPNRVMNPLRQAARFDPDGSYVRRWIPEIAALEQPYLHEPWRTPAALRRNLSYPPPIVDPDDLKRPGAFTQ
ncbi:deoxyribodipyrimidine photo-lyase [Actinocorallia longicatena]|uniref:Deoxyribodipyrimidine photo-lyase n=1 Tax=Actinocorallia longicatena TaxID=111803 RepID=A0ABP6QCA1_9ACTN